MDGLIDSGVSFSGNEPNCAFLNLGDNTFATVSALSGFDFPDDARAIALTDWDGDGDLDAWVTNRTAPTLRFLRNDTRKGRALTVRLAGLDANRDAAGARVELRLADAPDRPVVRTVKLGEGFLGQNSRALHFGLGEADAVASLRIAWPGGGTDSLTNIPANSVVTLTQGDRFPESSPFAARSAPEAASPLAADPPALAGAVTLFHPAPFPSLPSERPDGTPWQVDDTSGPVLVNLFASWCPDCAEELREWTAAADAFQRAGLKPVLLCADGRAAGRKSSPRDAWPWLQRLGIPFTAGTLTEEAFRRLVKSHQSIFGAVIDLPVPTSFLLDGRGRLAAVYRGRVPVARILADAAAAVKNDDAARSAAALPFPGRWLVTPEPPDPSLWLNDHAAAGAWDEALAFLARHREALRRHRSYAAITATIADRLAAAKRQGEAIAMWREALTATPDDPAALNNLADLLANAADPALRRPAEAVALASKAVARADAASAAAFLDTLAAAHAAAGDFKSAADTAARALDAARRQPAAAGLVPGITRALEAYRSGRRP